MTEKNKQIDNIFFSVTEEDGSENANEDVSQYSNSNSNTKLDLDWLLNDDDVDVDVDAYKPTFSNDDLFIPQIINYKENFTVKELFLICEYYGVAKEIKTNKYNKEEIIQFLVIYESNPDNSDIVFKRQNMWFYMNEIKNDKFMKKYILW